MTKEMYDLLITLVSRVWTSPIRSINEQAQCHTWAIDIVATNCLMKINKPWDQFVAIKVVKDDKLMPLVINGFSPS